MTELQSSTASEPDLASPRKNHRIIQLFEVWAIPLLLVAMTFAVFWPVTRFGFISYDDPYYVTSNRHVREGLTWSSFIWAFGTTQTANWHPVTWISHMTDVSLFGANPAGHHLMNVLFHSANVVLLFILLRESTGARWRSVLVAALFALHPLRVESVVWISERKDVLSAFFGLLTLLFYGRYVRERVKCQVSGVRDQTPGPRYVFSSIRYWLSLACFVLGLMSKPMLVTLPFVMLLLDYWPLGRMRNAEWGVRNAEGVRQKAEDGMQNEEGEGEKGEGRRAGVTFFLRLIFEKLPFFLLSAVFCVITFFVQRSEGAVVAVSKISMRMRIENTFVSYGRYLGKLIWPANLALPYPYPTEWPWILVIGCGLLTVGLCVAAWQFGRRWPFARTGWFWFFGTLIPVIGLVQVGNQSIADRYTYFPSIGIFILFAWGAGAAIEAWTGNPSSGSLRRGEAADAPAREDARPTGSVSGWAPWVGGVIALMIFSACAARTREQLGYWRDSETLFRHSILVTKNNSLALDSLGLSLLNQGRLDEAMACYYTALEIHPKDPIARDGVGCCFFNKGQIEDAIRNFKLVLEIDTNQSATLFNLGSALAQEKHFDEAVPYFKASLRLEPNDPDILRSLGNVYFQQKRYAEAANYYGAALQAAPGDVDAHRSLGAALFNLGKLEDAGYHYTQVLLIVHRDVDAHLMLARILDGLGRRWEARVHVVEVLKIKPGDAEATKMLRELQN